MIQKPFDKIEKADIDALVENSVAEGRTLDFKKLLPGKGDSDKKEFLADVSSFANASGGDLIFGMTEKDGAAADALGLAGINNDDENLRLDSSIRNGIEPRIPGLRIRVIEGFPKGPILLIRIPRSWASPHMVTFKGTSRFFTRNNAGKHQMDVGEIRASFTASAALPDRIRQFRDERLGRIVADETPLPLMQGAKIVMHVLPVESFTQPPSLDMRSLSNEFIKLPPLYSSEWDKRLNLDGLLTFDLSPDRTCLGYAQLFRTGAIETVDCVLLHPQKNGSRMIPTIAYELELLRCLPRLLAFQKELGLLPPIFVLVSMIGVQNYAMTVQHNPLRSSRDWNRIDRDTLLLPDVVVEDFNEKAEVILRPVFDAVWQSAGFPGSPNFDDDGNWIGR